MGGGRQKGGWTGVDGKGWERGRDGKGEGMGIPSVEGYRERRRRASNEYIKIAGGKNGEREVVYCHDGDVGSRGRIVC